MASALASPPPPWSFGASDLKRNARKFLERALVISALVHLAAVGAFRAAEERSRARDVEEAPPMWKHPVDIIPDFITRTWVIQSAANATKGRFVPTDEIRLPTLDPREFGTFISGPGEAPTPNPGGADGTDEALPPGPPSEPMHAFNGAEVPPVPIYAPLPDYPDFAREARIEGKVIVEVLVGTDGLPKTVVAISGPKLLFAAAEDGVKRWKFRPGTTSGYPVLCKVVVPVVFILQ